VRISSPDYGQTILNEITEEPLNGRLEVEVTLGQAPASGAKLVARTVKGTVIDRQGQPAVGVRVSLIPSANAAAVKTDAQGTFKVTRPAESWAAATSWCVVAQDPARQLVATVPIEPEASSPQLKLKSAGLVTGRVEDTEGKPIAGASIEAWLQLEHGGGPWGGPPAR
jgi:protocatechuate 3,4-dioxygenase beta subunit